MHLRIFSTHIGSLLLLVFLVACTGSKNPGQQDYPPSPITGSPDDIVESPSYPEPVEDNPSSWAPQPGDEKLNRSEAFINDEQILVLESFPQQFMLTLKGALPTPCHKLRVAISVTEAQKRIDAEVYSLVDPAEICIQVLEAFEAQVPLKGLSTGQYVVYVNGNKLASIVVP